MKRTVLTLIILILFSISLHAEIKRADLAGKWYTASPPELRAELKSYLEKAEPPAIDGKIIGIISPHAGYAFSGPVAAYGFKAVEGRDIKLAVIVGFSHRSGFDGIAVLDEEGYSTPLGTANIDKDITNKLISYDTKIFNDPEVFSGENSVEMEIPFLQMVLSDFKIVLIAIGNQGFENCRITGEALYSALKDKENFILVASTDMCHYLPYPAANQLDEKTISVIKEFDPENLYGESLAEGNRLMCGYGAVCATMIAAKKLGADKIEILKHANSGDATGDKGRVVGYLSAAMVKTKDANNVIARRPVGIPSPVIARRPKADEAISMTGSEQAPQSKTNEIASAPEFTLNKSEGVPRNDIQGDNDMLNEEQKKKMLKLARDSITQYLRTGKKLEVKESDPVLNREMGAFVTLHEHGELRGCIGNMVGRGPFYLTVRDMALEAATRDHRFRPVTISEMKDMDIEISALSPLLKIDDPNEIVMGKHGVIVRQGFLSGVYLPQVATETGWTREQFMNSLCGQKAGMASDAWKKGTCDIYIFTAEVFGEKK